MRESKENDIINTIDKNAFKANLLALNIVIEADRIGMASAGFAVIVNEVRNLVMRVADSAKKCMKS